MNPAFALCGICKTFLSRDGTRVQALENITFDVPQQKITCIVGPTGSGKSTLLRLLAGLDSPDSGEITTEAGAIVGYLTQEHGLFPWLKVRENIGLPLELKGRADREKEVIEIANTLGLAPALDLYPYELSGGMQQRAALGRLLAAQATHWLLDEPFSHLDERTSHRLQSLLLQIAIRQKISVLFVTHSIDEAVYLSDRIVVFSASPGKVLEIIDLDMPQPRNRLHPNYGLYTERIRTLIESVIIDEGQ